MNYILQGWLWTVKEMLTRYLTPALWLLLAATWRPNTLLSRIYFPPVSVHHVLSCHVKSCQIMSYPILLYSILTSSILHYHSIHSKITFAPLLYSTNSSLSYSAAITTVSFQAVASNVGGSNSGGHVIAVGLGGKHDYSLAAHCTQ